MYVITKSNHDGTLFRDEVLGINHALVKFRAYLSAILNVHFPGGSLSLRHAILQACMGPSKLHASVSYK